MLYHTGSGEGRFLKVNEPADKRIQISYHDPYYYPIRYIRLAVMHSSLSKQGLELDLARFRKRAGVSLEQIAQRTKIGSRFLEAIEDEQFERLPGGIFSTSYLRQYAQAIGYDEDALVAFYDQKMNPSEPVSNGPQTEAGSRGLLYRWLRTAAQAPR
jgi:transcriptional regulator with XRE-family HTH domain